MCVCRHIKGADEPQVVRKTEAMYRVAQGQLRGSGSGGAEDVVDALWRVSQGGRICTASWLGQLSKES